MINKRRMQSYVIVAAVSMGLGMIAGELLSVNKNSRPYILIREEASQKDLDNCKNDAWCMDIVTLDEYRNVVERVDNGEPCFTDEECCIQFGDCDDPSSM